MKLLSCRRAPDAKRGCPPATAVAGASSPSIPEAGAAPRHLSSGGQVGGGPLGPKPVVARALAAFAVPVEQTAPRTQRLRMGVFVAGRDRAPQLRTPMARLVLVCSSSSHWQQSAPEKHTGRETTSSTVVL